MAKSNECRGNGPLCMDAGDLAPRVAESTRHLLELGHAGLTVTGYDAAARHFAQWLALSRIAVADTDDAVIDRFARHRCRCPGVRREQGVSENYVRRVRRFVGFLGDRGVLRRQAKVASPPFDRRVVEFQDWLRQHRGITELTIDRHGRMVMRLLPALGSRPRSLERPAHSRCGCCRDEAGVVGLREDDGHGAEGISAVPRRAGAVPGWA